MRNLKKILALALALIMSLSLMMTASAATTFKDDGSINDTYRQAVEVLNGLEVLKGDDNGFRPEGNITRAEVAAIIYRITTGDVTDVRVDNFTPYGQFSDVNAGSWYAGYVTYSANAGYIKGGGDGKFNPNNNVTGYEVLTMILRTVGYDKAPNEFTGPDWQLHVASRAQELGILDNCADVRLGEDAKRQEVAEMIFRAILLNKVDYSTATLSYSPNSARVADVLGLERVEGVVTANEWADLEDTHALAAGKTRLDADGTDYTLNISSDLNDIGESRYAYVQRNNTNTYDLVVAELYDTGKNVRYDNEGAEVKSIGRTLGDLDVTGAERFLNFGEGTMYLSSDILIRYTINLDRLMYATAPTSGSHKGELEYSPWWYLWTANGSSTGDKASAYDETYLAKLSDNGGQVSDYGTYWNYTKTIHIGDEISQLDYDLMYAIFDNANKYDDNWTVGEVYTGTQFNTDISDEWTWKRFEDTYITSTESGANVTSADAGEWLKAVDNNNDGKADFLFLTTYTLDEVLDVFTASGSASIYYNTLDEDDYDDVDYVDGYEPAAGDVVLTYAIDSVIHIAKAVSEDMTVKAISFKDQTMTNTNDEVKTQSGIDNDTEMEDNITTMDRTTVYTVYYDKYGNIRAFELAGGEQYGLLTEVYGARKANGQLVVNEDWTAELLREGDAVVSEYGIDNWSGNPFINEVTGRWESVKDIATIGSITYTNNLQRAMAHLGVTVRDYDLNNDPTAGTTPIQGDEFWWHTDSTPHTAGDTHLYASNSNKHTWTNVARYAMSEDEESVSLYTASELLTKNGEQQYYERIYGNASDPTEITGYRRTSAATTNGEDNIPVFAKDYIQLNVSTIDNKSTQWNIHPHYTEANPTSNVYVNANDNTQFYVVVRTTSRDNTVTRPTVLSYTGYKSLPTLTNTANSIHAVYAVASNTTADSAQRDYWVADVIVIEVEQFVSAYTSVSAMYYTPNKIRAAAQFVESLNSESDEPELTVTPNDYGWNGQWNGYRFYALSNEAEYDETTTSADIYEIKKGEYNDYNIFAGEISRGNGLINYIDVTTSNGINRSIPVDSTTPFYIFDNSTGTSVARETNRSNIVGNRGIVVLNKAGSVAYVIDLDNSHANVRNDSGFWANVVYNEIYEEQTGRVPGVTLKIMNLPERYDLDEALTKAGVQAADSDHGGNRWIDVSEINTYLNNNETSGAALANWTVDKIAISESSKNNCGALIKDSSGDYIVTGVTGAVVLEVTLVSTDGNKNIKVTQSNDAGITVDSVTSGVDTDIKTSATNVAGADVARGTLVTIEYTVPSGVTLNLTVSGITRYTDVIDEEHPTKHTLTLYVTEDVEIDISGVSGVVRYLAVTSDTAAAGISLSKTIAGNSEGTLTSVGVVQMLHEDYDPAKYVFTVKGITIQETNGTVTTLTVGSDYTVTGDKINFVSGHNLTGTITVDAEMNVKTFNVDLLIGNVAVVADPKPAGASFSGGYRAEVAYDGTVVFRVTPNDITEKLAVDDNGESVFTYKDGSATISVDADANTVTVSGVQSNLTVTLASVDADEEAVANAIAALKSMTFSGIDLRTADKSTAPTEDETLAAIGALSSMANFETLRGVTLSIASGDLSTFQALFTGDFDTMATDRSLTLTVEDSPSANTSATVEINLNCRWIATAEAIEGDINSDVGGGTYEHNSISDDDDLEDAVRTALGDTTTKYTGLSITSVSITPEYSGSTNDYTVSVSYSYYGYTGTKADISISAS